MNTLKEGLSKPYFNPIILDKKQQQQKNMWPFEDTSQLSAKRNKKTNKLLLRFPSPSDHTHL